MLQKLANTCNVSTKYSIYCILFYTADGFNLSPVRRSTLICWLREVTAKEVNYNRTAV